MNGAGRQPRIRYSQWLIALLWLSLCCAAADDGPEWIIGETPAIGAGLLLPHKEGTDDAGYVFLTILDNRFVLLVLDAEKRIAKPDFTFAIVHYRGAVIKRSRHTLRLQAVKDKPLLTAPRIIPPPHDYIVRLLLMQKAADESTDSTIEQAYPQARLRVSVSAD